MEDNFDINTILRLMEQYQREVQHTLRKGNKIGDFLANEVFFL